MGGQQALGFVAAVCRIEARFAYLGRVLPEISLKHNSGHSQTDQERRQKDVPCRIARDPKLIPKRDCDNEQDYRSTPHHPAILVPTFAHLVPTPAHRIADNEGSPIGRKRTLDATDATRDEVA
jgi:hypothetical protein